MKKYYYIGVVVLALVITTIAVSIATFAFSGKTGHDWKAGHTWGEKDYEAKTQSMLDMTYEEWEAMMQKKVQAMHDRADVLEGQITEENFETMQEIYRLKQAGDIEGAKALMADFEMFDFGDKVMKAGFKMGGHWNK
jgi:hypothetical protein